MGRASWAALLVCTTALSGCWGSGDGEEGSRTALSGPELQHLTCSDWKRADATGRAEIVDGLRAVIGGQVTGRGAAGRGSVLEDELAYRLFDNYCQERFATAFSLYKLYGQASGFAGSPP